MYGYDSDGSFGCQHAFINALRTLAGLKPLEEEEDLLLACRRSKSSNDSVARLKAACDLRCLDGWRGPSSRGRSGLVAASTGLWWWL
eukprot:COSAG03_NODE_443_length_7873_cov_18.299588_3_plen_87_part_00